MSEEEPKTARDTAREKDRQTVLEMLDQFKQKVADVRGRRGRDFIRALSQGKLIDALDSGARGPRGHKCEDCDGQGWVGNC